LIDKNKYETVKRKLGLIKQKLGSSGASAKVAAIVYSYFNEA
jgi:hypothetical protein